MRSVDLAVIVAYAAAMLALGAGLARRQKTSEDYFLAGRSLGWGVLGMSLLATGISTVSYLSFPGEVIASGPGFLIVVFVAPVSYYIVAHKLLPAYLTGTEDARTIFQYLERRFDRTVRRTAAVTAILMRLGWMAMIVFTSSLALDAILPFSRLGSVLIVGLVATGYTALGGIRADVLTDVAQGVILFFGVLVTVVLASLGTGLRTEEIAGLFARGVRGTPVLSLHATSAIGLAVWGMLLNIMVFGTDQVLVQRSLAARSLRDARRSLVVNFTGSAAFYLLLTLTGFLLYLYFTARPELVTGWFGGDVRAHADQLFPRFISGVLPVGLAGLVMAALLAAAMSSFDSGVNSLAAIVFVDILPPGPRGEPGPPVRSLRLAAFGIGVLATALALVLPTIGGNLLQVGARFLGWFEGPMAAVFLIGVLWPRPGARAVLAGAATGVLVAGALTFAHLWLTPAPISFTWIIPAGVLATVAGTALATFATRPGGA
jgi:SSS family solute:Na+ symporter